MKFWMKQVRQPPVRYISREEFRNNRNLRRFRNLRLFFAVFNPIMAVILLAVFLLR
jgi:hypothetical protein